MNDVDVTTLTGAMMRASSMVRTARRGDVAAAPGLEAGHLELLDALQSGPRPIGWLAQVQHTELSTVSRRISRLVQLGLVEKVADSDDRRVQRARLTEAGQQALERVQAQREQAVARIVGSWDEDDRATLEALLVKMADQLQRDALPPLQG